MDLVIFADFRPAAQTGMGHDTSAAFDRYRTFNYHIGADLRLRVNFRSRIDYSCPMNAHSQCFLTLVVGVSIVLIVVTVCTRLRALPRDAVFFVDPGPKID